LGLTVLRLEVVNPANPDVVETVEFLIDSGAFDSIVPRPVLERLGIVPLAEYDFRLSNGQHVRRRIGAALYRYQDRVGAASVIFGEEGDCPLLGTLTLTALGLGLAPLRRELVPFPMTLA
jgi:predicted aspartyl protease